MIITTFSPAGYAQYGWKFIETYKEFCNLPLVVYVEDDLKIEGVDVRNLFEVPGCRDFLEIVKGVKANHYRNDVNKFCRKVFAMTDSHRGKYAFIGADTVFHKKIPHDFLDSILDGVYIAYLGRKKLHSETDFIAFNGNHKIHNLFQSMFIRMYTTGAFQHLKYACDSDVFDHIRTLLSVQENNLNVIGDEVHPFVNSILGEYAIHLKGPQRKMMGKCFEGDYVNQRRIPVRAI